MPKWRLKNETKQMPSTSYKYLLKIPRTSTHKAVAKQGPQLPTPSIQLIKIMKKRKTIVFWAPMIATEAIKVPLDNSLSQVLENNS